MFKKWDGGMDWIDLAQDRGQVASSCECSDGPPGSIKWGELGRTKPTCKDDLELFSKRQDRRVWIGFIWLRIGTSGGILWRR
jgi:hypothetical protein